MFLAELRTAFRGVRGRGWRAVATVLLLAVAIASNAIVFAAADAFVFRNLPYSEPGRLAVIERLDTGVSDRIWPSVLRRWQEQRDIFSAVRTHDRGWTAYVTSAGITESIASHQVEPGLFEMLGVVPKWGRPFAADDAVKGAAPVAIVSESLARRLFGDPASSINRSFPTGNDNPTVVGVMPAWFMFPTVREEIWRPLDMASWPENASVATVARLAFGVTVDQAARMVEARAETIDGRRPMRLRSMADSRSSVRVTTIIAVLAGAGVCLLLIVCANIASLEAAGAARRTRDHAVLAALGASPASLFRGVLYEGATLVAISTAGAFALTFGGMRLLDRELTRAMRDALAHHLTVDIGVICAMSGAAALTWLATSTPAILRLRRQQVADGLRRDPRTTPVNPSDARLRHLLMSGQVALTTVLAVGALLFVRTYGDRVGAEKGFDATNVATIEVLPTPDIGRAQSDLEADVLARIRSTPGVQGIARINVLPPASGGGVNGRLKIDDRAPTAENVFLHVKIVDPEYFRILGLTLTDGQWITEAMPPDQVIVDGRFARAYWPDRSPLGSRFKVEGTAVGGVSEFQIAGVSRDVRSDRVAAVTGEQVHLVYMKSTPKSNPLTFVARLDDEGRIGGLASIVRSVADRSVVRVDTLEARYARLEGDTRIAALVSGGFAFMALLIAVSGIYAVMSFLVAGRTKELAIRIVLGADRRGIYGLVVRSSLTFVAMGACLGMLAVLVAVRWLGSHLYGADAAYGTTLLGVSGLISGTALLATWLPARRATMVDPAVTLRAE